MKDSTRILTVDQAIALAQENITPSHFILIEAYLGQVDVPANFSQVGGGGITSKDGLHYSQWANEQGELLIMFTGLGLFTYRLDLDRMPEGLRAWHEAVGELDDEPADANQDSTEYPYDPQDEQRDD